MKAKGKKCIALFLVFSFLALSANLHAKERRGATLIITKNDGQQIKGELITVKPSSLLLLDTEGKDVSIVIVDIKVIRIVKKNMFWKGARIGGFIGAVVGALLFLSSEEEKVGFTPFALFSTSAWQGAAFGAIFGGAMGTVLGTYSTIQIEGMSDSEIQETMDYLRKKARIREYK